MVNYMLKLLSKHEHSIFHFLTKGTMVRWFKVLDLSMAHRTSSNVLTAAANPATCPSGNAVKHLGTGLPVVKLASVSLRVCAWSLFGYVYQLEVQYTVVSIS